MDNRQANSGIEKVSHIPAELKLIAISSVMERRFK